MEKKGKFNVDPVFLFFVYSYLIGVFERSLYGIGKTAHSADRFIGGGTNVSFELGNETFYWLIKACHQIQKHFESNNHMNEMLSDIYDCHEEVTIKHLMM